MSEFVNVPSASFGHYPPNAREFPKKPSPLAQRYSPPAGYTYSLDESGVVLLYEAVTGKKDGTTNH
jgi:hypothetical protein